MIYCPRCAAQNVEDAKFCRQCGTDISLVPQALTGHLPPAAVEKKSTDKDKKAPTLDKALENIFLGVGFLLWFIVGAVFFTRLFPFWFWAPFPAFACLGSGIGQYVRWRQESQAKLPAAPYGAEPATSHRFAARTTEELPATRSAPQLPRGSVTDGTTRLFDSVPDARTAIPADASQADKSSAVGRPLFDESSSEPRNPRA